MSVHENNGACGGCLKVIEKYPGANQMLVDWFKTTQAKLPELHTSCFGRGYIDQMDKFKSGNSKAVYGLSAHNWNCAGDFWVNKTGLGIYDEHWFYNVLAPEIPDYLEWAAHWKTFPELPHIQYREWELLKAQGLIKLVEAMP